MKIAEMRVVPDVTPIIRLHSDERGRDQTNREQPAGNRDWHQELGNPGAGEQENIGKDDPANATRSAVSAVFMVAVNVN